MEEVKARKKIVSKTFVLTALATAGCGAFDGFCDEMHITLPKSTYWNLFLIPPIVQAVMGIYDGLSIAERGRQLTGNYPDCMEKKLEEVIEESGAPLRRNAYAKYMGGMGEGLAAIHEVAIGYGIGRLAGKLAKHIFLKQDD